PLGELPVPADALYGIQTERARQNFPISHLQPLAPFVDAVVWIKKAAALVHKQTGRLDPKLADAIVRAADEVLAGQHRHHFVVDPYQAGAGTSHNMNCNEVLANRANELLGGRRGEYRPIHPNDHVNMAQSTNDVIPTAIRLGALSLLPELERALERLARAFEAKGKAFDAILKSGRTHLQDATPIRLGQEFGAYGHTVDRNRRRITAVADDLRELGIGGTAVGTGLNAQPQYAPLMVRHLQAITGLALREGKDRVQLMQSMGDATALLELNVMMPVIAHNLFLSLLLLTNASRVLAERCVEGIEADAAMCAHWLDRSPALVTALAPKIGYAEAAKLAKEALAKNETVRQLVIEKGLLKGKELDEVLNLR